MKKIALLSAAVFLSPMCGHAAPLAVPATTGTMLSTNLGAAVVKLDMAMSVNPGTLMSGGFTPFICPGGDCGTAPITGLPTPTGCTSSPENPTALLAVLGLTGLLLGRFGYRRMRSTPATAAA